jgi:hypothetical protein
MSLELETPVWGIISVLGRFEQQVVWENFGAWVSYVIHQNAPMSSVQLINNLLYISHYINTFQK